MQVRTQRMCFEGTYVRFRVYTPEENRVLCRAAFVGSPLGDCESWDSLCEKLAVRGCLCVSFEMPGFGHTPVGAPQDNATRAALMWGVLDEVEYSRGESGCSWHLVSHGSGCGTVLKMAQDYSENVLSRVLISPVEDKFKSGFSRLLTDTKPGKWALTRLYAAAVSPKRFKKKMEKLYGCSLSQERLNTLTKEFVRPGRTEALMKHFQKGYRVSAKAYRVQGPVMLIWGRNDMFGAAPSEKLTKRLTEVEMHYLDSAHMSMETMPQEMSEYLNGWFKFAESRQKQLPTAKK